MNRQEKGRPRPAHRIRNGVLAAMFMALAPGAKADPVPTDPNDIPAPLRFDLGFGIVALAYDNFPIAPRGPGTLLATSTLEGAEVKYTALEGYIPRPAIPEGFPAFDTRVRDGKITVPILSGDKAPLVLAGKGAVGIEEFPPERFRYTDASGTVRVAAAAGKTSLAAAAGGQLSDPDSGVLAGGMAMWYSAKDIDPAVAGDQGGLLQAAFQMIARSEDGPLLDWVSATQNETVVTGLRRGQVALSPEFNLDLLTTLNLDDVPKPGRNLHAVFSFAGFVSFLRDPLWEFTVEFEPDGTVLSQFKSADALRKADEPATRIDDAKVQETVDALLKLTDDGKIGPGGTLELDRAHLFDAVIVSERAFDYRSRVVTYMRFIVPEPGTLPLAMLGGIVWLGWRSRNSRDCS